MSLHSKPDSRSNSCSLRDLDCHAPTNVLANCDGTELGSGITERIVLSRFQAPTNVQRTGNCVGTELGLRGEQKGFCKTKISIGNSGRQDGEDIDLVVVQFLLSKHLSVSL